MPKNINDISPDPQQQILLLGKFLSREMPAGSGNSFDALLTASLGQMENQSAPAIKAFETSSMPLSNPPAVSAGDDSRFREILATVLKHEGSSYVQRDGGGAESSRFGVLQSTAKQYGYKGSVKHLTRADAEAVYKKIWDKSGAASLPYPLSLVHFDTYVNSPAAAVKLLKKSGGSASAYLAMRAQRYTRLAELRPERYAKYLKGWMNRVTDLRNIAAAHSPLNNFAFNDIHSSGNTVNNKVIT